MKAREYTNVVDHMSTSTGIIIPFARWRWCQRHGVAVADEAGRIPRHALRGCARRLLHPGLLLQLLWWRWSTIAEPWRRSKGVRLLHVLLLGGEGDQRWTKRYPEGVRWVCPWVIVVHLVLRADAGAAGRLLLLVATAPTATASSPLLAVAGSAALPLTVVVALACTALPLAIVGALAGLAVGRPTLAVTDPRAAVGASGGRTWSSDEGGRRGGGRRIGGPGCLTGGGVIDVDLLE